MGRLIDADALDDVVQDLNEKRDFGITRVDKKMIDSVLFEFPTVDAIPLDTKIVVQTYDEEHEEWSNEIMTIQGFLDSGMCEIYREELRDQYDSCKRPD